MTNINTKRATGALIIGHMAGMVDMAALPVWVGTLISGFGFQPAQAGGLATLFLIGVVVATIVLAPFFHKMSGRWLMPLGFLISSLAFYSMTKMSGFSSYAIAHLIAGLSTGMALSFTHGSMGRTMNPHRIFAYGSFGLGIIAIVFLGGAPVLIAKSGPQMLFAVFAAIMLFAAIVGALFFPHVSLADDGAQKPKGFTKQVWFVIFAIMCMAFIHAMSFSFVERVGSDSGFSFEQIQGVLVATGFVGLLPSLIAAFMEKRLSPSKVGIVGGLAQLIVAYIVMQQFNFPIYAIGVIMLPFVMIFTHTFVFGHLAKIEPTGRAVAATPAMIMTGSAIAPLLGGVLVQNFGYTGLGFMAVLVGLIGMILFNLSRKVA